MNRLLNALAFAAVVIAAFVMESNLPQRLATSPLAARVMATVHGSELPVMAELESMPPIPPIPPQADSMQVQRVVMRAQEMQQRVQQREMRAVERVRVRLDRSQHDCKVIRIDQ